MGRIKRFCAENPDREWNGTLFYREAAGGLECADVCLESLGEAAYVESDFGLEAAAYYALNKERLLGCKAGHIHSHNAMGAFFSGQDLSTFKEQASARSEILSVVTNNRLDFVGLLAKKSEGMIEVYECDFYD